MVKAFGKPVIPPKAKRNESLVLNFKANEEFQRINTNEERIIHILANDRDRDVLRAETQQKINEYSVKTDKNRNNAKECRDLGIDFYEQKQLDRALESFTKAIRFAPHVENPDLSDELFLAYRQRAVVYHELQEYERSLFDIDQALDLCQTLADYCHRIDCLRNLRRYTEVLQMITELLAMNDVFQSDIERRTLNRLQAMIPEIENERQTKGEFEEIALENDVYLFVDDCVDIVESNEFGRYMKSKSDINKGSLILKEKAQYSHLIKDFLLEFCNNCHKRNGQKFFPCVWCTECVFCDVNCYMAAMTRFHRYECGVTGVFYEIKMNIHMAFRILLTTGYTSAQELLQYLDNCFNSGNPFDVKQWIEKYNNQIIPRDQKSVEHKREEFEAFLTFLDHNDTQTLTAELFSIFEAIEMVTLIDISHAFIIEDDQTFISLTNALIKISRKIQYNSFAGYLSAYSPTPVSIASVICLVSAMCNHSCVPNVVWALTDDIQDFRVFRSIKAGEEICNSYGPRFKDPLMQRRKHLKDHYNFTCSCVLCTNESQGLLSLRCLACSGPVFNSGNCLACGQPYVNYEQTFNTVEENIQIFNTMAQNIDSNLDKSNSIETALRSTELIQKYIFPNNMDFRFILSASQAYQQLRQTSNE